MFATSKLFFLLLAVALLGTSAEKAADTPSSEGPEYSTDGQLKLPEHYREWVYLTSDFYAVSDPAKMQTGEQRKFNNIFVNPEAYRGFLQTGTWPDKTMLVVEQRAADDMGSPNPNQKGTAQSSEAGLAVHVKDEARLPAKWAFFGFHGVDKTAKMIPVTAGCYSCHAAHGAAETTFVQFYPTLLPIAESKNTLTPAYHRERETPPATAK
jgi:Cytochrome P460